MTISVRHAEPRDLEDIVEVFLDCWTISYRDVMPERLVSAMTPARATRLWSESLADESSVTLVADDGRVVGMSRYGLDDSTVYSLYVSPSVQGGGLGRLLLDAACAALAADGAPTARLWVFQSNLPSRAFYERNGWNADGTTLVDPEYGEPQTRLVKALP